MTEHLSPTGLAELAEKWRDWAENQPDAVLESVVEQCADELTAALAQFKGRVKALRRKKSVGCAMNDWESVGYCRACDDVLTLLAERRTEKGTGG